MQHALQQAEQCHQDDDDRNKRATKEQRRARSDLATCAHELAVALVFRLDEVRQDVFVRPADGAVRRPFVIVEPVAAHVQHVVGVARAAQTLARVPHAHLSHTPRVRQQCTSSSSSSRPSLHSTADAAAAARLNNYSSSVSDDE